MAFGDGNGPLDLGDKSLRIARDTVELQKVLRLDRARVGVESKNRLD
jgi:hypothetical protein